MTYIEYWVYYYRVVLSTFSLSIMIFLTLQASTSHITEDRQVLSEPGSLDIICSQFAENNIFHHLLKSVYLQVYCARLTNFFITANIPSVHFSSTYICYPHTIHSTFLTFLGLFSALIMSVQNSYVTENFYQQSTFSQHFFSPILIQWPFNIHTQTLCLIFQITYMKHKIRSLNSHLKSIPYLIIFC